MFRWGIVCVLMVPEVAGEIERKLERRGDLAQ
jgi:hypothetical protein